MKQPRVVVTDYTFPDLAREKLAAEKAGAIFVSRQCRTADEVIELTTGADVVLVQFAPVTKAALRGMSHGARVVRYGVGYDNIDVGAAAEAGIPVAYIPDYCTAEVADHTATMILATLRKLSALEASIRSGEWAGVATLKPRPAFSATIVGFIGLGRIGRAVLERLRPFGFQFLILDPTMSDTDAKGLDAKLAGDLNEVLSQSDIITLHAPASPTTHKLVNGETLALMKPTAAIVNTARGDLIDAEALADALSERRLSGAALDVFPQEPLPADSPLRKAPNLTLSPHIAWYSDTSMDRLQELAAEEIRRAFAGEPVRCPVPMFKS